MIDALLRFFSKDLTVIISDNIVKIYLQGSAEMITWGKTKGGIPIQYEGPPIDEAIAYAKNHITKAKLVDGINEETRRQISKIVSDGIKNKRGIPGIKSDIRHKLDWMSRGAPSDIKGLSLASRAEMIARTETNTALSQASLDRMHDMGVSGKEWITIGDDRVSDDCMMNESDGPIPVDQAFSSGVMSPPQHPNCRCSLAPVMLKK